MTDKNTAGGLLSTRTCFKPFKYPWAYEAFMQSEQMHWLWTEVPMLEDVKDYGQKLTDSRRSCASSPRATSTSRAPTSTTTSRASASPRSE